MWRFDDKRFAPWPFFLGAVLGFAACCAAGRVVSHRAMFRNFLRFFEPIQPQREFYPTASELISYIRHTVPHDKHLVLVGGASYFRGTGQNPDELWSSNLQQRLGDGYAVVNFANDRAGVDAFAGVIFDALAREYPDMIYVASGSPIGGEDPDGGVDYRYLFWDAYYKGLLPAAEEHAPAVLAARRAELKEPAGVELHLGKWIDSYTYACDLWTYLGYNAFFTVFDAKNPSEPFRARGSYIEYGDPYLRRRQLEDRVNRELVDGTERNNLQFANAAHVRAADGTWSLDRGNFQRLRENWEGMFPPALRPRVYDVLVQANPYFMQRFTAGDYARMEENFREGRKALERAGYQVVDLNPADFTIDDYVDGGHYAASGGRKVAAAVAAKIHQVERLNAMEARLAGEPPAPVAIDFSWRGDEPSGQRELVTVSTGDDEESDHLFLVRAADRTVRLGYRHGPDNPAVYSLPLPGGAAASGTHRLEASLSGLYPASGSGKWDAFKRWAMIRLDGKAFWEVPVNAIGEPRADPVVGDQSGVRSVARPALASERLDRAGVGGAVARLQLDPGMVGRAFPLVTTGETRRGDVLFFRVGEGGVVTFGYDHWNGGGGDSAAVKVGYGSDHVLEFSVPALVPEAAAEGALEVKVDGRTVWDAKVPHYSIGPEQVYFGGNPIGATSTEAAVEGVRFERVLRPTWGG